jgi:superfamily II DNA or RNA helicase
MHPRLLPDGVWIWQGQAELEWQRACSGGVGAVLVHLGTDFLSTELPADWRWLRDWARRFFTQLCQAQSLEKLTDPSTTNCAEQLQAAPPFLGAEYLSTDTLQQAWRAMKAHLLSLPEAQADVLSWLQQRCPAWQGVGRISFHLAENPADAQRPFGFLATYAEKLNAQGQIQHLPLARAIQQLNQEPASLQAVLAPVRAATADSELLQSWLASRRLFQPMALTAVEAYAFLTQSTLMQHCGIVVKLPDWWQRGRSVARPQIQISMQPPQKASLSAVSLLHFKMERSLDGAPLTEAEWAKLMSAETGLVSLRGRWVEVDALKLRQVLSHWQRVQQQVGDCGISLLQAMRWLSGMTGRPTSAELSAEVLREWSQIHAAPDLQAQLEALTRLETRTPPPGLHAQLRLYQQQGYAWLCRMTELGLGACLADDMGLGKTLQVIALMLKRQPEVKQPALLVLPASLLGNWQAELARFSPGLRFFVAHPSATERPQLNLAAEQPESLLHGHYDVVITTYTLIQRFEKWQQCQWSLIVLDEAQAIKNPGSQVARCVKRLRGSTRLALTGTPVENQPGDLWSLFDFLNPGLLGGSSGEFAETLAQGSGDGFRALRRLLSPYLLRRLKTDPRIVPDLPPKTELRAYCRLTRRQATLYAKLVDQLQRLLANEALEADQRQGQVLGYLQKFKQICNHPSHWSGDGAWRPEDSGKFKRLGEITRELALRGERVLIFTQFQETCAPLADYLSQIWGRPGLILHGGTPVARRAELVADFQQPDGPPFMVISVKAGGTGLNLTAASHVIHFDRWWNPAVENQATDRAYRIGQQQPVMVHLFITQGTIEARIDSLLRQKSQLAHDLLSPAASMEKTVAQLSNHELLDLIQLREQDIEESAGDDDL